MSKGTYLARKGCLLGFNEEVAFEVFDTSRDGSFTTVLFFQTDFDHDELPKPAWVSRMAHGTAPYLICKRRSFVADRQLRGDANLVR